MSWSCSEDVVENIQSKLQDIRSPLAAMGLLLRELDLETDPEANPDPPLTAGQRSTNDNHEF